MQNEFGEEISDKEISDMAKRIKKLPPKAIDELWFRCGFIHSMEEGLKHKAMYQRQLDEIASNHKTASFYVSILVTETHIAEVRRHLADLEKEFLKK